MGQDGTRMKEEIDSESCGAEEWSGFGNWIGKVGRRRQQKKILQSLHLWMNGECSQRIQLKGQMVSFALNS